MHCANTKLVSKLYVSCLSVLILLLSGCSQNIKISTYADYDFLSDGFSCGDSFAISTEDGKFNLLDKEIIKKMKFALQNRGFKVTDIKNADYVIIFNYEMQSEVRTEYIEKTVGTTSVEAVNTKKISDNDRNSSSEATGTVVATEKRMVPIQVRYYNKTMQVTVSENNKSSDHADLKVIWTADASIFNKEQDLRLSLNYLLAGIFNYFGKNTNQDLFLNISYKNKTLQEIRDFKVPKKTKSKK